VPRYLGDFCYQRFLKVATVCVEEQCYTDVLMQRSKSQECELRLSTSMTHAEARLEVSAHLTDARGKACPMPIIDLSIALRQFACVELWADDPAAVADVHAFIEATGHRLQVLEIVPFLKAVVAAKAP
jgi:TusA-related sulfurtransferase